MVCTLRSCAVTLRVVVDMVGWNCVLQRNGAMLTANILPLLCWKLESYWRVSVDQVPSSVWNSCHQRPPQLCTYYNVSSTKPVSCDGSISSMGFVLCGNRFENSMHFLKGNLALKQTASTWWVCSVCLISLWLLHTGGGSNGMMLMLFYVFWDDM